MQEIQGPWQLRPETWSHSVTPTWVFDLDEGNFTLRGQWQCLQIVLVVMTGTVFLA